MSERRANMPENAEGRQELRTPFEEGDRGRLVVLLLAERAR